MQCERRICITVSLEGNKKFREEEFGLVVYIVQSCTLRVIQFCLVGYKIGDTNV